MRSERPIDRFSLSVSPDERFIIYSQSDHSGSDLMLIENFVPRKAHSPTSGSTTRPQSQCPRPCRCAAGLAPAKCRPWRPGSLPDALRPACVCYTATSRQRAFSSGMGNAAADRLRTGGTSLFLQPRLPVLHQRDRQHRPGRFHHQKPFGLRGRGGKAPGLACRRFRRAAGSRCRTRFWNPARSEKARRWASKASG